MGKCSVKLRHHPCYNTDGDGNLINHWQVSQGQSHASGVSANDSANAVVISGCNKHAVTVYEHGHGDQNNHNQHVYTFKDGYWETAACGKAHQVDHDWLLGDEISSVKIEALPQDNLKVNGQVTYEIEIPDNNLGYNTRLHGGEHTAWMYRPDGGGKHKDMPIGNGFKGYPCTNEAKSAIWTQSSAGIHGNPKRGQKMHCTFDITETKMKSLNEATKSNRDPRRGMYNAITQRVCDGIWESNPDFKYGDGDKTCWDKKKSQRAMEKFCGGSNIKNPSRKKHCNTEVIGQALYDQLASKYCDANPDDPFCGCYNVVKNKCRGEEIDKEIKRLEDGRKPIEGVRHIWYGFKGKIEYLNIAQIEVYSGGVNILKDNDDINVVFGSIYETSDNKYGPENLFDGNYDTFYHSAKKFRREQVNYVKIDLGKEYTIDEIKVFNRKSCGSKEDNNICNDRWAGSYVKLHSHPYKWFEPIAVSEQIVGDHKEGGVRVKTFFDNGVAAAKEKLNLPGCKITIPIRRTLKNLPPSIPQAALDGTDKCWGNVCASKGGETFVPENTIVSGGICSKPVTICNIDLKAGNLQDSDVNIEQKCGEQEGTPAPMSPPSSGEPSEPSDGSTEGTPAPMDSSGKSSSVPLTSTSTAVDGVASTEELEIYEEPAVQIGAVTTSIVSLSSCFMLLLVLAM